MARGKPPAGTMSKRKMVKEAIDKLGDVGPTELQKYVSDTYGVDMGTGMISSYKSGLKKQSGSGSSSKAIVGNQMIALGDIKIIQDLVNRHGAAQLAQIIKMLGK